MNSSDGYPGEMAGEAAYERFHDAVVDLLDVLAERGDRLRFGDAELAVAAERLVVDLTTSLTAPLTVDDGPAALLDVLRTGLRAITTSAAAG